MKRLIWLSVLAGFLAALITPCSGAGLIIITDTTVWPGPVPPPRPAPPSWPPRPIPPPQPHVFAPFEVTYVKVNTRITDQVAVTAVDQEFYNPNAARLEGTFVFPVPKGAHLDKFTMEIDGKQVEAELLSSDKGRSIYEDIVRKMRDPALLEYADRDLFKVRIFPFEPNSRKRITLSYTELLKSDNNLVSYSLPLSMEKLSSKPIRNVSVKVSLDTQRPLKSIYSPTHLVEIKRDGPNRATAGYEASDLQPESDFTLYFAPEKDVLGVNLLAYRSSGQDGYFLLLASPGVDVAQKDVVPKDVVFVLDTSGSMAGKKIEQAKKALQFCVENLNDNDRFEILRFSTEVEPLFDKMADASRANRDRAETFVKNLPATGGTAVDDALKKALSLQNRASQARPFVVVFLTDGRPTIGLTDEKQIVTNVKRENDGHTRIFCFGIGTDVNTHFLDNVAEETRALGQYVLPEEDIEIKVSNFFAKIKEPVLVNPTLRFTGDIRTTKLYPAALPDLFKGEQLVLVGRYSGQGDSAISVEGTANNATRKFTYEVRFPAESSQNEFIPRLWATRRVGYLLDEIRLRGESSELRDEVTDLARKYGIVTPYTAYLIVEDEKRRDVPQAMRSMQRLELDTRAREAAQSSYDSFRSQVTGAGAVADAMSSSALKSAPTAPEAASQARFLSGAMGGGGGGRGGGGMGGGGGIGGGYAGRGVGGAGARPATAPGAAQPPPSQEERLAQYTEMTQFVAGKNFFQNGDQWLDADIQKSPNAKKVRLQFGSTEYFDFMTKHPKAAAWLALGQNVQFVLDNTIYEIYE